MKIRILIFKCKISASHILHMKIFRAASLKMKLMSFHKMHNEISANMWKMFQQLCNGRILMVKSHKNTYSKKNWWKKSIPRTMMGKINIAWRKNVFKTLPMNQESWMWPVIRRKMNIFSNGKLLIWTKIATLMNNQELILSSHGTKALLAKQCNHIFSTSGLVLLQYSLGMLLTPW